MKTPKVVVRILRDKGETPLSACCVQSSMLGAFLEICALHVSAPKRSRLGVCASTE